MKEKKNKTKKKKKEEKKRKEQATSKAQRLWGRPSTTTTYIVKSTQTLDLEWV